jgi:ATP-dependent metalloprotease FtsH
MFRITSRNLLNKSRRFFSTSNDKSKDIELKIHPLFIASSLGVIGSGLYMIKSQQNVQKINWLDLKKMIMENNNISKIELHDNKVARIYKDNMTYIMTINDNKYTQDKIETLDENIIIENIPQNPLQDILSTIIPSVLFFSIFLFLMRRQQGGIMNLFRNEAKVIEEKTGIKLTDIAGLHQTKNDVLEFSEIVMKPERYLKLGTKIPTGILMEGPPGTGKTMLAKAIADKFDSKFYLINGSDFIQPIVGTGTMKVKELFKTARENKPAIIFIDEIDAIGKSRNTGKSVGNDERDNILNSLLVEMDGFEDNSEVLIMGATNRVDSLDQALLRPGRFDRVVKFDLPDLEERKDILNSYYPKYKINNKVNQNDLINNLGMSTYGFNGAMISNLFNEASIRAVRSNLDSIDTNSFNEALEYVTLGNRKENFISKKEKEIIAYHEAGHALISYILNDVPSPNKVSIVPRANGALGFSQAIPEYEKKLYTKEEFMSQIMVMMGGRVAEEIILKKITNGASDDIDKINKLANDMITKYGMGKEINFRNLDNDTKNNLFRKESAQFVEDINEEVEVLINYCYVETKKIIKNNISFLEKIKEELITKETIDKNDLDELFNK